MKKIILVAAVFAISGCSAFKTQPNPVGVNQLGDIESAYGVALSVAVGYRNLRMCKTGEVVTVSNVCAKHDVIIQLQVADQKAQGALAVARDFIKNNPNVSAVTVLFQAQSAVNDFKAVEAQYGVK